MTHEHSFMLQSISICNFEPNYVQFYKLKCCNQNCMTACSSDVSDNMKGQEAKSGLLIDHSSFFSFFFLFLGLSIITCILLIFVIVTRLCSLEVGLSNAFGDRLNK